MDVRLGEEVVSTEEGVGVSWGDTPGERASRESCLISSESSRFDVWVTCPPSCLRGFSYWTERVPVWDEGRGDLNSSDGVSEARGRVRSCV